MFTCYQRLEPNSEKPVLESVNTLKPIRTKFEPHPFLKINRNRKNEQKNVNCLKLESEPLRVIFVKSIWKCKCVLFIFQLNFIVFANCLFIPTINYIIVYIMYSFLFKQLSIHFILLSQLITTVIVWIFDSKRIGIIYCNK